MKHISILVPVGHSSIVNIGGAHQIFSWVNEFFEQTGRKPPFAVQLVGLEQPTKQTPGLFTILPDILIDEVGHTDLIILPAIHGDFEENRRNNSALVPWLIRQYEAGAEIASLCVASFFLASTGLLDGRLCSTHWQYAREFRTMFPNAYLRDDKILTEADGIYTSGGAYSFTNLLLYLIEKHAGRDTAVMAAKGFMIDIDRDSQSPFIIFSGQKMHDDAAVLKAQEYIEQHFQEKITVDDLCKQYAIGRRTFERRFKKATGNTVVEYVQRVKIEAAKKDLEKGRKTVNEVMFDVGYMDTKAFRDVFKKYAGLSPARYRTKYAVS